jgi:UDP-hydrolysing UDP-N-acetyl-D-glucosamine 2-epimerase
MNKRKICVLLVDRANYGRLKPVMTAIAAHQDLELQVLTAGTMVLERFGLPTRMLEEDGFRVDGRIFMEIEGSYPVTMAKSVGFGVVEFAGELQRLQPDVLLVIGDRYEALAAVLAAAYMNICVAHIQGGEVSGSIDESARHAMSKFSHFHFPSTKRSAQYLVRMGERPDTILAVGCPSADIAKSLDLALPQKVVNEGGSGAFVDVELPFLLVVFHPTTTHYGAEKTEIMELLEALGEIKMPTVLLWPNIDAGADHISRAIRRFRDQQQPHWLRTQLNLSPENYLRVLAKTACAVGNSSSFVRDAGYFGTPVVLLGQRQEGREWDAHVKPTQLDSANISAAIQAQLTHGRYPPSTLYGDGAVSPRIAEALANLKPYVQKKLNFIYEDNNSKY